MSAEIKTAQCHYPEVFKNVTKDNDAKHDGLSRVKTLEEVGSFQNDRQVTDKNEKDEKSMFKDTQETDTTENEEGSFYKESVFRKNPTLLENWRNKANSQKSLPLRDAIKPKKMHNQIDYLSNGKMPSSRIKGITISNTCAFDALTQAIVIACLKNSKISMFLNSLQNKFSQIVCALRHKDYSSDIYKLRTELLRPFFKSTSKGNLEVIDCSCNVFFILEKVIGSDIFSGKLKTACSECRNESERIYPTIPIDFLILSDHGISALDLAALTMIEIEDTERDCKTAQCNGKQRRNFEISDNLIFFEVDTDLCLKDVPAEMLLKDKIFYLGAIIEFIPPLFNEGIGHYKVYCKLKASNNYWECFDDMSNKILKTKTDSILHSHLVMYHT